MRTRGALIGLMALVMAAVSAGGVLASAKASTAPPGSYLAVDTGLKSPVHAACFIQRIATDPVTGVQTWAIHAEVRWDPSVFYLGVNRFAYPFDPVQSQVSCKAQRLLVPNPLTTKSAVSATTEASSTSFGTFTLSGFGSLCVTAWEYTSYSAKYGYMGYRNHKCVTFGWPTSSGPTDS